MRDMDDESRPPEPKSANALERAEAISRFLAEAARRARFSARARGAYHSTGFESRRGAKAMRIAFLVMFVLMVAIPNLVSVVYFGLLASDQYVAEAKFTVSSGAIPKLDGLGSVTGVPQMMIAQNILIVTSYIESRPLVEELDRKLGMREMYGSADIDWWARFNKKKPIEKFVDYWNKMTQSRIAFPSGIVTLTVRAFEPAGAKTVADAVLARCEQLINELNDRMREDTVRASEQDVARATEQLKVAWLNLERARNAEGLIDVRLTSKSQSDVLSGLESELLKAQGEYETRSHYVTETAPQQRVLKNKIASLEEQIAKLKAQLTSREGEGVSALARQTLSGKMTKFASLDLEHQIAETRYAGATASLDAARRLSETKMLYLHQIEAPALPEEARYPKRWLDVGAILAGSLALWGACVGMVIFVRNNMA
jgi:capsular polysaccharide transport system permease protein